MPINKFGISFGRTESYYQWNGLIRNYVRDNALCMTATDFDAKSRKIRRVALPIDDDDVANKRYVQHSVQVLKDRQEEFERKMEAFQNDMQIMLNELQKAIQHITRHADNV